jgi:hypothetical protein
MSKIYDNGVYREMNAEEIAKGKAEIQSFEQSLTYEERVEILIRQRYSISAEFAILRQRDTKPEEFAEYNAYAEQCKIEAKNYYIK